MGGVVAFHQQDLLLERNALLEHAYAMVAGSGQGPGSQPNGSRDRDAAGVDHEATAWWLTKEMQVQTAGTSVTHNHFEQRV
jgi:hypothetical protein